MRQSHAERDLEGLGRLIRAFENQSDLRRSRSQRLGSQAWTLAPPEFILKMSRFYEAFFIRVCLNVDGGCHVAGEVVGERDGQIGQPGGAANARQGRRFEAGRPSGKRSDRREDNSPSKHDRVGWLSKGQIWPSEI